MEPRFPIEKVYMTYELEDTTFDPDRRMTPEREALARRAVTSKGWKWLPGMLVVGSVRHGDRPFRICAHSRTNLRGDPGALPDFGDAATIGCLLLTCPEAVYWFSSAYGMLNPLTVEALVVGLEGGDGRAFLADTIAKGNYPKEDK